MSIYDKCVCGYPYSECKCRSKKCKCGYPSTQCKCVKKKCVCGQPNSQCKCLLPPASVWAQSRVHSIAAEQFTEVGAISERVILAEVLFESVLEANFCLPGPARTITPISRRVMLTKCRVIPVINNPRLADVILEGVVHMHFNYVRDITRVVKDFSVNVPFRIYERVELANELDNRTEQIFGNADVLQADETDSVYRLNNESLTVEVFHEPVDVSVMLAGINVREFNPIRDGLNRISEVNVMMDLHLAVQLNQFQRFPDTPIPTIPPVDETSEQVPRSIFQRLRQIFQR